MKILIATAGTRGDVQPFIALGRGLVKAGHQVTIATDRIFETFIRQHGIDFFSVSVNTQKAMQEDVRKIGGNPLKFLSWLNRNLEPIARQAFIELIEACAGVVAVIYSALMFIAPHVADGSGKPSIAAFLVPSSPAREFSSPTGSGVPLWLPFRGRSNWLSFRLPNQSFFLMTREIINQCRRELLDLPALPWRFFSSLDTSDYPILQGYSAEVIPEPAYRGEWLHLCGSWFLEESTEFNPPTEFLNALEGGAQPVYIGFGSMVDSETAEMTSLVAEVTKKAGVRAVLLGGWSNLGEAGLPTNLLWVDSLPHNWLFPRVAAVIHHGGAGTAGVPLVGHYLLSQASYVPMIDCFK